MTFSDTTWQTFSSMLNPEAWPAWVKKLVTADLPVVVFFLLVLLIAYKLANLTWDLFNVSEVASSSSAAMKTDAPTAGQSVSAIVLGREIAQLHLLGEPGRVNKPTPVPVKATETSLNLKLHGVFVGDTPKNGIAIIGESGDRQQYYSVGETLSGGAVLEEVNPEHVIISSNGRFEILRFPKLESIGGRGAVARTSPPADRGASPSNSGDASLKSFREEFKSSPDKIMDHANFVPVKSAGKIKGFRVLPKKDRRLYNQLGVKPSDLVTAVNGIPLDSEQQSLKVLSELAQSDQVELSVLRQGKTETIILDLSR